MNSNNRAGYDMESSQNVVESVGRINFTGNIIPAMWYHNLRYESGKPNLNAIILLSEIVYWYRPIEIRDEATGQRIELRKKFKADKLQRSYDSFARQFGLSKRQVKAALKFLQELGIITLEFRTIETGDGLVLGNVMFIGLNPARLEEITHDTPPSYNQMSQGVQSNVTGGTTDCKTYTENTTENTTKKDMSASSEPDEGQSSAQDKLDRMRHRLGTDQWELARTTEQERQKQEVPAQRVMNHIAEVLGTVIPDYLPVFERQWKGPTDAMLRAYFDIFGEGDYVERLIEAVDVVVGDDNNQDWVQHAVTPLSLLNNVLSAIKGLKECETSKPDDAIALAASIIERERQKRYGEEQQ